MSYYEAPVNKKPQDTNSFYFNFVTDQRADAVSVLRLNKDLAEAIIKQIHIGSSASLRIDKGGKGGATLTAGDSKHSLRFERAVGPTFYYAQSTQGKYIANDVFNTEMTYVGSAECAASLAVEQTKAPKILHVTLEPKKEQSFKQDRSPPTPSSSQQLQPLRLVQKSQPQEIPLSQTPAPPQPPQQPSSSSSSSSPQPQQPQPPQSPPQRALQPQQQKQKIIVTFKQTPSSQSSPTKKEQAEELTQTQPQKIEKTETENEVKQSQQKTKAKEAQSKKRPSPKIKPIDAEVELSYDELRQKFSMKRIPSAKAFDELKALFNRYQKELTLSYEEVKKLLPKIKEEKEKLRTEKGA